MNTSGSTKSVALRDTYIARWLSNLVKSWGEPRHENTGIRCDGLTTDNVYEFVDALALPDEPAADDLHLMLMAQATSRLQNIHELEAELARVNALADKLWRLCVDEGWPWNDGSTQDDLTELGLLYPKDMTTAEGEDGICESCDGDCKVCYRAVKHVRDAKQPETKAGSES